MSHEEVIQKIERQKSAIEIYKVLISAASRRGSAKVQKYREGLRYAYHQLAYFARQEASMSCERGH